MKIYNIGSANIDYVYSVFHITHPGETLSSENMQIFPGGKGLNQAIALSKAGAEVIFVAITGKSGSFLLDTLKENGVDTSRIKTTEFADGHAIIQVDNTGQNSILLYSGTNYKFNKEYIEKSLFDAKEKDILLLQNEINCLSEIFNIAHEKKMQIAFNPSPIDSNIDKLPLSYVKWWFCNEIEAQALFKSNKPEEIVENFLKKYPESSLILTLGINGSIFANSEKVINHEIYKINAIDTTAAGDTFTGYYLSQIARGKPEDYCLKIASKAASIAVSREGAAASIPLISEVNI